MRNTLLAGLLLLATLNTFAEIPDTKGQYEMNLRIFKGKNIVGMPTIIFSEQKSFGIATGTQAPAADGASQKLAQGYSLNCQPASQVGDGIALSCQMEFAEPGPQGGINTMTLKFENRSCRFGDTNTIGKPDEANYYVEFGCKVHNNRENIEVPPPQIY